MRWTPKDTWEWTDWFAWHPVTIDGQKVWLETVERRLVGDYLYTEEEARELNTSRMLIDVSWEYRYKTPQHPALVTA